MDLPGPRVEHDDGPTPLPEGGDGGPLEVVREGQGEVLGVETVGAELGERVGQRIAGEPRQLGVIGAFEARPAVHTGGIADDLADRAPRVDPVELAIGVLLVVREDLAAPVPDESSRDGPRRRDDRRIVR